MNVSDDLLLLIFKISGLTDRSEVISEFIKGMKNIFRSVDFHYTKDKPAEINSQVMEVSDQKYTFGYIQFEKNSPEDSQEKDIFKNAVKLLASFLEQLQITETSEKEKESFRKIADERFKELSQTIAALESSKNAAINLVEDVNLEMEKRLASERALRDSEERWKFAVEGSGAGLWDWNLADNKVFYSNQWKRILGYETHEIENDLSEWKSRVHPDDLKQAIACIDNHLEGRKSIYINEHRLRCKDGSYKWVLDQGKIISYDKQGNPARLIGTLTDISERIDSEKRIRENERQLSTLMGNLPGMSYRSKKSKGRWEMTFASKGCKELTGYVPDDITVNGSVNFDDLIVEEDFQRFFDAVEKAVQTEDRFISEYRIIHKDGDIRWVWEQGMGRKGNGGVFFMEGFIMDITNRKNAELGLRELKDNLQNQVKEKTKELQKRVRELERFHQATIDREFRIKELRDEIEILKSQA